MKINREIKILRNSQKAEKGVDLSKRLAPDERVSLLEDLRQQVYLNIRHEYTGRLQRVLTVIKK